MQTVNMQQTPSINDVLKISLAQVAEMVDNGKQLDEGQAGYLAGYLDCIRAKTQENEKK
jgi:hypothetical protein